MANAAWCQCGGCHLVFLVLLISIYIQQYVRVVEWGFSSSRFLLASWLTVHIAMGDLSTSLVIVTTSFLLGKHPLDLSASRDWSCVRRHTGHALECRSPSPLAIARNSPIPYSGTHLLQRHTSENAVVVSNASLLCWHEWCSAFGHQSVRGTRK